jgi:hypothetical protein
MASLPPPPPFWQLYASADTSQHPQPPALPDDATRTYQMFGEKYARDLPAPTMQDNSVLLEDTVSTADLVTELRRLNNSILVNFLLLTELLLTRRDQIRAKLDELAALFATFHHLVNRYREVQARDTLAGYLERQVQHRRNATLTLRAALAASNDAVRNVLAELDASRANVDHAALITTTPAPDVVAATTVAADMHVDAATTVSPLPPTTTDVDGAHRSNGESVVSTTTQANNDDSAVAFIRHSAARLEAVLDAIRRPAN